MSASSDPQRVRDLVHRFGWDAIVRLAALGIQNLAEAQVFYVDCGAANALDADDGVHGLTIDTPLATIDYAIGLCKDSEQAVIIAVPGHYEDYDDTTTGFDADVPGIRIIGMGEGSLRPRFDFTDATSKCVVGANDVHIENVVFRPSVAEVAIGLDIESGKTGCVLKDVEFAMGEEGNGTDEFIKAIHLTSANHDCVFENVKIFAHASCDGATHGIHVDAASNRLTFKNVVIDGPYTNGIAEDAAGLNHIVEDCSIDVTTTNYGFHVSSTFAKYTRNVDAGVDSEESEPLIEVARGTGNYPTGITDNSILAYILGSGATASASTFNNTTDSLQAIADAIAAIDNTTNLNTAVPDTPTAKSLQDILSKADGSNTYDNTTDSLEAISDFVRTGTSLGAGIQLDHLQATTTGVDADDDLTTFVADKSVLSHIMTAGADTSDYDASTDSLQAIADAVAAITDNVTAAVSQTPTARSLHDILEKDASGSFDDATDSLEAISDALLLAIGEIGTPAAGSALDILKKLYYTADGTGAYPATVANDSTLAKILAKGDTATASTYNNTTDSLEAIRDHLDGTTVLGGIYLDHLAKSADGAANYPASMTTNSQLAMIMASDGDPTGYNKTTDSLEAIRDHLDGSTVLAGIQLDTLAGVDTTVAADGDLTAHCVDGSILAHIMSATKDTSTYKASTDSLEAISVALAAGTGCSTALDNDQLDHLVGTTTGVAADSDLETYCVAGSLISHLASVGADITTFKASTDSLEAIRNNQDTGTGILAGINLDHLAKTTTGVSADGELDPFVTAESILGHIMASDADPSNFNASSDSLQAIGADTDAIIADLVYQEKCVEKAATSTDDDLFDVTGEVLITSFVGIVTTTPIGGVQNRIKIGLDATDTVDCDFSTEVDTNGDVVGTRYVFSAANPAVLTPLANGAVGSGNPQYPWVCKAGVIKQFKNAGDAGTTGQINWYCTYKPLSSDGAVAAAS